MKKGDRMSCDHKALLFFRTFMEIVEKPKRFMISYMFILLSGLHHMSLR